MVENSQSQQRKQNQKQKMLVLAPQPFFSPRGTPFSVYYRSMVTAELGYEIDLLTYGQGSDVAIDNVDLIRGPRLSFLGPVKTGPSAAKLVHDGFMFFKFLWLVISRKYDVVHAHEEAVFFAAFMKPIFGYRLIYDMHSSLPEQLDNFGYSKSRLLKNVFEFLEVRSLRAADAIITICPALRDQVAKLAPWAMPKHELIENSIFEDVVMATPVATTNPNSASPTSPTCNGVGTNPPDPKLLAKGKTAVVYAGTLESYQGIDILLKGVSQLAAQRDDFALIIAGGSEEQVASFKAMADELGASEHVQFLGQIIPRDARFLAANADIILSPRSSGTNTPLKTYEQLACGVPLVATKIYSHTQVLTDDLAVLVEPTAEGMADGIRALLDTPELGTKLVDAAKAHYAEHYARPVYTQKLNRLLELVT